MNAIKNASHPKMRFHFLKLKSAMV